MPLSSLRAATISLLGTLSLVAALAVGARAAEPEQASLERLRYNNDALTVDLGVGLWAWPIPTDLDGDGDNDLVVCCPDKPYNGLYFFENADGTTTMPVFRPAVRLGPGQSNVTPSYVSGQVELHTPGRRHPDFRTRGIEDGVAIEPLPLVPSGLKTRANQWLHVDYDGDGDLDFVLGASDWGEYGWDNAFDSSGNWTNGPLHGYVFLCENTGSDAAPDYAEPVKINGSDKPIDVYGAPSPNLADFDGDGDLDILCGEFLDRLTYFENIGTRSEPTYAAGRHLQRDGDTLHMELCMMVVVAYDWDNDGNVDVLVGKEDGRVALLRHTGNVVDGLPQFEATRYFQQQAADVKVGALVTPSGCDWDGDGDDDLVCGNTAGYLEFVENLGTSDTGDGMPRWAAPVRLLADGEVIRIMAGPNGSIQGPCEAKWGYTVPCVADWNHDGLLDIVINSIWGKILWYENCGTPTSPQLRAAQAVTVAWDGPPPKPAWFWWTLAAGELASQWRTTPLVTDLTGDGLNDLVMLDHEGYLALFERRRDGDELVLLPPQRIFQTADGEPLRLNDGVAGKSGRRKFVFFDYDGDGRDDLVVNGRPNIDVYRRVGSDDEWRFENKGAISDHVLAGHTTCPTTIDLDGDGQKELLIGAEDGYLYRIVPKP
ncbi:MAG: VCBS repeat-containing protein [Planctomycetales bacterium]|nr:VCBS repeat-containing protein [Planctomycetales bacterium]